MDKCAKVVCKWIRPSKMASLRSWGLAPKGMKFCSEIAQCDERSKAQHSGQAHNNSGPDRTVSLMDSALENIMDEAQKFHPMLVPAAARTKSRDKKQEQPNTHGAGVF